MKFLFYTSGVFLILIGSYLVLAPSILWEAEYKSTCLSCAYAKCPIFGNEVYEDYECGSCTEVQRGTFPRLDELRVDSLWVQLPGIAFFILGIGIFVWKREISEWVGSLQTNVVARCSLPIVSTLLVVFGLFATIMAEGLFQMFWLHSY